MKLIDYQKEVVQVIDNSFKSNKISHAYIYEGEQGSGLLEAAMYFAKKLLCLSENKPCDACGNCKKINNSTHTNLIIIKPIQNVIRKDQINSLIHEIQMTSLTDKSRIYVISEAEKMNRSAANTILKFLEEPHPDNYVLLLTENSNMLLDTIVSRSQLIRFKRINKNVLVNNLKADGIEEDMAYILSEIFGSYEFSKEALKTGDIINSYEMFKRLMSAKAKKQDLYIEYFLNKKLLQNVETTKWLLDILSLFKREEIRYIENEQCNHFKEIISSIDYSESEAMDFAQQIEAINIATERVNLKVNPDLVFASLFQLF